MRKAGHLFANVPELAVRQGPPAIVLHPLDADARGLRDGDVARIHNDRGGFRATVTISGRVRPGVVEGRKGHWPKLVAGVSNPNATVAERDSDMGGGAVFHDNRVEVAPLGLATEPPPQPALAWVPVLAGLPAVAALAVLKSQSLHESVRLAPWPRPEQR